MRIILICLILYFLLIPIVHAEEVLNENQFIEKAIKNNPQYQVTKQEYLSALKDNKSAHAIEDWNLVASGVYQDAYPAATSGFSPTYQNILSYSFGIDKYFSSSGTALQIEHNNQRLNMSYPAAMALYGFATEPYYLSDLSVTISQPLLKNAFGYATRAGLDIADAALKLAEIKLKEDWEDFIASLKDDYLTWQQQYLNLKVQKKRFKKAKAQLKLIKRQRRYGLSEDLDVVQTEQLEKGYALMLEQAEMNFKNQTRKVFNLMGEKDGLGRVCFPQKINNSDSLMGQEALVNYLIKNSNIRRTADLLVAMKKKTCQIKRNAEWPDANLVLQARPNSKENALQDSVSRIGENDEYTVTLNVKRGLFNDQAQAERQRAEEDFKKAKSDRDNILLNSKIGLQSLYNTLNSMERLIKLSKTNLKLATKRLRLEEKKLRQGRNSMFFVLQAEAALLEAENNLNANLIAREKTINSIKSITDRYLVEYRDVLKL
ncbi:TolC family protein [Candidatus Margulisiibacteriota bacterium]